MRHNRKGDPYDYKEIFLKIHMRSCQLNGANYDESFTKTRKREIITSRQMSYSIFKDVLGFNLTFRSIGSYFGQDHVTVFYHINQARKFIDKERIYTINYNILVKYAECFNYVPVDKVKLEKTIVDGILEALKSKSYINAKINIRNILYGHDKNHLLVK